MKRHFIQRAIEAGRAYVIRNGKRLDVLTVGDADAGSPDLAGQVRAWLSGRKTRLFEAIMALYEIQIA